MDKRSSLGMPPRLTPRNIQQVQASKLGDAQGIPFFINKKLRSVQTLRFYCFMHNCVVLGAFLFLFLVLFCLVCLNKLVGPPHSYVVSNKLIGVGKEQRVSYLQWYKRELDLTTTQTLSCHARCCFDLMLSDYCCSLTCSKQLRLLNVPLKNHALFQHTKA